MTYWTEGSANLSAKQSFFWIYKSGRRPASKRASTDTSADVA
ncbi:MAG: hypothetical protein ACRCWC_17120 [Plesiomonas shigelloides]